MNIFTRLTQPKAYRFEQQVRPHLDRLYRYANRLTGHPDDAEDLVQELLLSLYKKDIELDKLENIATWLLKSLYHQFIDFTRKQKRNPSVPNPDSGDGLLEAQPDQHQRAEQLAELAVLQRQISLALATLSPDIRALVVLHDMEGVALSELTVIFDAPLGTLKSRLHRARHSLREQIIVEPLTENERVTG